MPENSSNEAELRYEVYLWTLRRKGNTLKLGWPVNLGFPKIQKAAFDSSRDWKNLSYVVDCEGGLMYSHYSIPT